MWCNTLPKLCYVCLGSHAEPYILIATVVPQPLTHPKGVASPLLEAARVGNVESCLTAHLVLDASGSGFRVTFWGSCVWGAGFRVSIEHLWLEADMHAELITDSDPAIYA